MKTTAKSLPSESLPLTEGNNLAALDSPAQGSYYLFTAGLTESCLQY